MPPSSPKRSDSSARGDGWIRDLAAGKPSISVVIPTRQEEAHIDPCLQAILAQDVEAPFEVLVVDGMSTDRTRELVAETSRRDPRVRLLDNPGGIVPPAMNIGTRAAKGDFIVRVDGHCRIPPDYLREVLRAFRETGAECVGGSMVAEGRTHWGTLIADATSTAFGMGGSRFHGRGPGRYMDTVYLGAYPRQVLLDLGLYDERFVRNQDDELNYRLRRSGGKVYFTPRIWAAYTTRSTLRGLCRQYAQYGWWKVRVYRKHPGLLQLRHLVPATFLSTLLASVAVAIALGGPFRAAPATLLGTYLVAAAISGIGRGVSPPYLPGLILVFFLIHISYGAGFLAGLTSLLLPAARDPDGKP